MQSGTQEALSDRSYAQSAQEQRDTGGLARFRAAIDPNFVVTAANSAFLWRFGARIGQDCRALFTATGSGALTRRFAELPVGGPGRFSLCVTAFGVEGEAFPAVVDGLTFPRGALRLLLVRAYDTQPAELARPRLTTIEAAILEGLAAGESASDIAPRISLSRQGVDYHVRSLVCSFRVANKMALVAKAYHAGLMLPEVWPPQVRPELVE